MKFALAAYGARGDVDPCVAVGRELLRRGHHVQMAVPPNLVGFAEAAGLDAVAYGQDARVIAELQYKYWTYFFGKPWKTRELGKLGKEISEFVSQCWGAKENTTLMSLADGADLIIGSLGFEQFTANVAEYYDIPLALLLIYPVRANGYSLPFLPPRLSRAAMTAYEWLSWSGPAKEAEDTQRRALGLPKATTPWPERIAERGSLEIQAYDKVCFPRLEAEWASFDGRRPFTGALTMAPGTDADEEVTSWIAAGTPPIYFGFGSIAVGSTADTLAMIAAACEQLGERALVCAGGTDFRDAPQFDHVKVVDTVNYATIFPLCRALVHHGGSGTTAAGLRAGVPTLILWTFLDQPVNGGALKRLKVGTSRRCSTATEKTLVADLRRILDPQYLSRARQVATQMTKPAESITAAADLVENFARLRRTG